MEAKLHNGRLDAARGIAAIVVFSEHTKDVLLDRLVNWRPATFAMEFLAVHAVLIFFLLSGYLITKSITGNIDRNGAFSARDYLLSRVTRIYPPLIGTIAICCIVWAIINFFSLPGSVSYGLPGDIYRARESYSFQPFEILQALAMRQSMLTVDGPLWTLFIEFQIYLMAMAVAVFWQRNRFVKVCSIAIGILAFTFIYDVGHIFLIIVWGLGAAAALFPIWRRVALPLAVVVAIGVAVAAITAPQLFRPAGASFGCEAIQLALCCLYCVALFGFEPTRPYPRILTATGGFSYSLYVVHFPLLLLCLSLTQNWVGHSLQRAAISMAISVPTVLLITIYFARIAENQRAFIRLLTRDDTPASFEFKKEGGHLPALFEKPNEVVGVPKAKQ
jgi:peptidoglycan/LPS O-acetylase OafA/YrhL